MMKRKWITAYGAAALVVWMGCQKAPDAGVAQAPSDSSSQVAGTQDVAPQIDVAPTVDTGETLLVTLDVPNMV